MATMPRQQKPKRLHSDRKLGAKLESNANQGRLPTGEVAQEQLAQLDGLLPMPGGHAENHIRSPSPVPGQSKNAGAPRGFNNNVAPADKNAAMDPNIDPALQEQEPRGDDGGSPEHVPFILKRISEIEYQQLRRTITVDLLPVNGPNEGPPEYEVLPAMWDEYVQNLEAGMFDEETVPDKETVPEAEIEPSRRKRTRRQEELMMEEADKVVGRHPTKRSRAAEAVARHEAEKEGPVSTRRSTRRKK